jgi:hypothetical protein
MQTERDSALTGTYTKIIILEAAIIFGLWILGRLFS